jgi:preprotein translocase subunit YajC
MTGALVAVDWLVGATKKSSGISPIIIIYAVIAAAFYFLYYRPRKRKAQEAREVSNAWEVGDEVLTAGGLVGYIIEVDGDRVTLETSVGASFVVLKQYVIRKIEPVVPVDDIDDEDDGDEYEDDVPELEEHYDDPPADASDDVDDDVDDEAGHEEAGDEDEDVEDDEPVPPPPANRRARRQALRKPTDSGEDPSGNDGAPTP